MTSRGSWLGCIGLLLLISLTADARPSAGGGRSSGGVSRPATTAAPAPYRPTAAATAATPPATSSFRTFGGPTPFGYSRAGYRSTPLFMPFAAGALAGTALHSLNSDRNAYCNGFSVQCYKSSCKQALSQCKDTNSTELVAATCPDPRFSECWQSTDQVFQCFGTRRPRFGNDDVVAYCNQALGNSAANVPVHLVTIGALALLTVLLL